MSEKPINTKTEPPRKNSVFRRIRNRIIAGLFVSLPVLITFLVISYIVNILVTYIVGPIAYLLLMIVQWRVEEVELPWWVENIAAPVAAFVIVLVFLFFAGIFFRSRLHRMMDWVLLTVPGVNTIYSAVRNVFNSIQRTGEEKMQFQRVVLIDFPHPGAKVPAFVTNECRDTISGRNILCIYVPTTPIPTSGYMLMIPDDEVVPLDWDIQTTLQAIVSGGITMPETVNYSRSDSVAPKIDLTKELAQENPDS